MMISLILLSFLVLVCAYAPLKSSEVKLIVSNQQLDLLDPQNTKGYLEPILKIRTPGSEGAAEVRSHFKQFFESLDSQWNVEFDNFTDDTPTLKNVSFTNVIATRYPPGSTEGSVERLILAAHYDSKIEPQGFLGAIDSAFSCALMMYVVKQLDDMLTIKWKDNPDSQKGLQIVLLDGEEAFKEWSETDSIYGARHLASKWESEKYHDSSNKSKLDSIGLFVLMDLLGASNPSISSFYQHTDWAHINLRSLEKSLRKQKVTKTKRSQRSWFARPGRYFLAGQLGDDHLPFLEKGVPILHLIPLPFPEVWHTITDDGDHLDRDAIHDWALIMTVFTAEYMELTGYMGIDFDNTDL